MTNNNDEKKITFDNHRIIWRTPAYLREKFDIKVGKDPKDYASVKNFLYQLHNIPEQRRYRIVGYGSLMSAWDAKRTMPNYENFRLGYVSGYERIFNIGYDRVSFLNVRSTESELPMQVSLLDIPFTDLPDFIIREGLYNVEVVEVKDSQSITPISALMVIGEKQNENDALLPQLNYLHLCLSGIKEINGIKGVINFIDSTYCYSPKRHQHVTIREWLKELDIIDYMFMNDYSSR